MEDKAEKAKQNYTEYVNKSGGKDCYNEAMPDWEQLPDINKSAWIASQQNQNPKSDTSST